MFGAQPEASGAPAARYSRERIALPIAIWDQMVSHHRLSAASRTRGFFRSDPAPPKGFRPLLHECGMIRRDEIGLFG